MPRHKIGVAQIRPALGDLQANLKVHLDYIAQAKKQGVELLIFPELSLTGYFLKDLNAAVALHPDDRSVLSQLHEASRNLDLVVGFVEEDERHRFYIASAYLSQGEIKHVHHKVYLPTYGMFSDGRFFAAGEGFSAFPTRFGRAGVLICEDGWHLSSAYLLWMDGADILIHVNATPGRVVGASDLLGQVESITRLNQVYAEYLTCFVIFCNRVGTEDGATFWGGSVIVSPSGEVVAQAPHFEEALITGEIDLEEVRRVRSRLPLLRDEKLQLTLRELTRLYWKNNWPSPKPEK